MKKMALISFRTLMTTRSLILGCMLASIFIFASHNMAQAEEEGGARVQLQPVAKLAQVPIVPTAILAEVPAAPVGAVVPTVSPMAADAYYSKERNQAIEIFNTLGIRTAKKIVPMVDGEFQDIEGRTHRLSDYKGKVILLNLWATWCPACKKEMPSMDRFSRRMSPDDYAIIAITAINPPIETEAKITAFAKEHSYHFPLYIASKGLIDNYDIGAIPATFVIDKNGTMVALVAGAFDWNNSDFIKAVELLNAAPLVEAAK